MRALVSGLIGGVIATILLGWAIKNTRPVSADREGWRTLRPGVAIWGGVLVPAALSLFLFYIYFFVGSSRADAETQMMYCLVSAAVFGLCSLATAYFTFSRAVSWRDDELRVRPLLGAPIHRRLSDLRDIELRSWSNMYRLTFADGYVVKVSPYEHGVRQLLEGVAQASGDEWRLPDRPADRGRSAAEAAKGVPACLSAFVVKAVHDTSRAEPIFVDYRISCRSCGGERFQILSRPMVVPKPSPFHGLKPGETLLQPPHELRCGGCGRTDVVFDPRRHGYDGVHDHPSSYTCSDAEGEAASGVYHVTVTLGFNIDWDELCGLAQEADLSPRDLFDVFWLRGEPTAGGAPLEFEYECA